MDQAALAKAISEAEACLFRGRYASAAGAKHFAYIVHTLARELHGSEWPVLLAEARLAERDDEAQVLRRAVDAPTNGDKPALGNGKALAAGDVDEPTDRSWDEINADLGKTRLIP